VASTGVIGEPLPYEKIIDALPNATSLLSADAWEDTARAIMTTDTFPKGATRTAKIGDSTVTINGIAKGSGMIAPDMATMLAFIATDAAIPADTLQAMLSQATATTFNAITVDSDTSTSDTVLLFATGQSSESRVQSSERTSLNSELWTLNSDFYHALHSLCLDLAQQIVRDGEGASKFLTVEVTGAESDSAAKAIALSIANSPLIKTAVAGQDPNWGRIVMAVGKSGQRADRDRLKIWIGPHKVAENGMRHPSYDEKSVAAVMQQPEITFRVDLGLGNGRFTAWTCDFTEGYVRINADYRS
jgi:glutamate N-acetyltransferase / amino-acid N-acetyltransferase